MYSLKNNSAVVYNYEGWAQENKNSTLLDVAAPLRPSGLLVLLSPQGPRRNG